MSEKKQPKTDTKPSEKRECDSSKEPALVDPVSDIPSSESSANPSSHSSTNQCTEEPPATEGAAAIAGPSGISETAAATSSPWSSARKRVSTFFKNWGSKKDAAVSQSPKKSGLSLVGLVTSAVDRLRKSPEKTSLVNADHESPPPQPKPKKEFYCKIDTFVDREGKCKTSGNLTDSTSLETSSEVASPSTPDKSPECESSPTEDSPLLKPDKPPSKEQSTKKDNHPKK